MNKTLKNVLLVPLASFVVLGLAPASANADGGDYLLPVVTSFGEFNATDEPAPRAANPCEEARKAVWFAHELERSDGEVSPAAPNVTECNREVYAASDE
jgi:hypothetical protein